MLGFRLIQATILAAPALLDCVAITREVVGHVGAQLRIIVHQQHFKNGLRSYLCHWH